MLLAEDVFAGYEPGVPIVRGANLSVSRGEIVAILGPNGAGKSTLIKAIAGVVAKFSGRVTLGGEDITHAKPHEMVRRGLAFVPQTENIFASMTVEENLQIAAAILPKTERAMAAGAMVLDALIDHGVPVAFAVTRVRPRLVSARERLGRALGVTATTAVLELDEVMHLASGEAVQHSTDVFAPDLEVDPVRRDLEIGLPAPLVRAVGR